MIRMMEKGWIIETDPSSQRILYCYFVMFIVSWIITTKNALSLFLRIKHIIPDFCYLLTMGKNNAIPEYMRQIWRKHIDYQDYYCVDQFIIVLFMVCLLYIIEENNIYQRPLKLLHN